MSQIPEIRQIASFSFALAKSVCLQCEWMCLFYCSWFYPVLTGEGTKLGIFLPNCPNWTFNVRVTLFHNSILWQYDLLINKPNQLLVKCISSICNWWHQGELGFCCRGRTMHKHLWACLALYMCVKSFIDTSNQRYQEIIYGVQGGLRVRSGVQGNDLTKYK